MRIRSFFTGPMSRTKRRLTATINQLDCLSMCLAGDPCLQEVKNKSPFSVERLEDAADLLDEVIEALKDARDNLKPGRWKP